MARLAQKLAQPFAILVQLALFPARLAIAALCPIARDVGLTALDVPAEALDFEAVVAALVLIAVMGIGVSQSRNGKGREGCSNNDDFRAKHGNFLSC